MSRHSAASPPLCNKWMDEWTNAHPPYLGRLDLFLVPLRTYRQIQNSSNSALVTRFPEVLAHKRWWSPCCFLSLCLSVCEVCGFFFSLVLVSMDWLCSMYSTLWAFEESLELTMNALGSSTVNMYKVKGLWMYCDGYGEMDGGLSAAIWQTMVWRKLDDAPDRTLKILFTAYLHMEICVCSF